MRHLLHACAVLALAAGSSSAAGHGGGGSHAGGGGGFAGHAGGGGFVGHSGGRGFAGGSRSGGSGGFGHFASLGAGGSRGFARATRSSAGSSFFPSATRTTRGFGASRSLVRKAGSDDVPPNYSKPGALIRTEGQLPTYTAASGATTHAVDGGGFIGAPAGAGPAPSAGGTGITENAPRVASNAPAFDPSF
jgi:hypothetical protein